MSNYSIVVDVVGVSLLEWASQAHHNYNITLLHLIEEATKYCNISDVKNYSILSLLTFTSINNPLVISISCIFYLNCIGALIKSILYTW